MAIYSINDLENLCGVKAHTLRMWEKRYNIIEPKRTKTNCRYYSDYDLNRLLNITFLNKNGFKISRIASMSEDEINSETEKIRTFKASDDNTIEALIFAMLELSDYKFNKILDHHSDMSGFEQTMTQIIYPFLEKVALMSICDSVTRVHQNFVKTLIKKKIIVSIDKLPTVLCPSLPRIVLFLKEGETQELNLLFFHFLFKKCGAVITNIGSQVDIRDVVLSQKISQADYVFTLLHEKAFEHSILSYISTLKEKMTTSKILISTILSIDQTVHEFSNVTIFSKLSEVNLFIKQLISDN